MSSSAVGIVVNDISSLTYTNHLSLGYTGLLEPVCSVDSDSPMRSDICTPP